MKTGLLLIGGALAIFGYALVYNGLANMPSGAYDKWFPVKAFGKALIPSSLGVPTGFAGTVAGVGATGTNAVAGAVNKVGRQVGKGKGKGKGK